MKKLAIGCFAVLVVAGIAIAGGSYYAYMKVKSTVQQFAQLGQASQIERGIRAQQTYVAPATGELTARQVEQLMKVLTLVRESAGQNAAAFQRNYQALAEKKDATVVDMPALVSAYRDLASGWVDAKKAQVDALNAAGLSLSEYRWIRAEAYRALDIPFFAVDYTRLVEQVKSGSLPGGVPLDAVPGGAVPPRNKTLLEPHRKQLADYLPFVAFGL
ncbi:MAG TPA: hypothetical protein VGI12_11495 [Vicinamibacterales bacterium]|jgi:hypothetical protein